MNIRKKTLLGLSDSAQIMTGYATIFMNILNRLTDEGWDCYHMGHNVPTQPVKNLEFEDGHKINYHILGASTQPYCRDLILPRIQKYQPDVFMVLLDTFMLYPWFMEMNFAPAKSIFYFPSDGGGGMPLGCENILKHVSCPVAMSKFAQRQVKELYNIDAEYIPHAIDHNLYYPLPKEDKEKIKREFIVKTCDGSLVQGALTNKFVVGCVARNQGRKMLDRQVKAFAQFAKDKPDVIMYFHSDSRDAAAVFDIVNLVARYGIQNKVVFANMNFFEGIPYTEMNKVYNIMDIFFLSTSGEGFGIPTVEAMACKIPPVVTDYTTTQELLVEDGVCGLPVKCQTEITGSWNVERGIMDIDDAVVQLNKLYYDRDLIEKLGSEGRKKVLAHYTWDNVMLQWRNLLNKLTE